MKIPSTLFLLAVLTLQTVCAQDTLSVLFLGNSYTAYNNLPQLVQSVSSAAGKTLLADANMPGGFTISNHINNATSLAKINQGNWDYIVIQEQSQVPTIDYYRYNDMYPALMDLKALVAQVNPCTRIITYMTWGRRFGGQQCDPSNTYCSPVFADFNHMQDSLTSAYMEISELLQLQCAPVGVSWQQILNDTNLVLHATDNSHPNIDGSYVAALTLFSTIWKAPSAGLSFNAGINPALALYYQHASDNTVFNGPDDWNLNINAPLADFNYTVNGTTVSFTDTSISNAGTPLTYAWAFGDGTTSAQQNPVHTYASNGLYAVQLVVTDCIFTDTITYAVQVGATGLQEAEGTAVRLYPNPTADEVRLQVPPAYIGTDYLLTDALGRTVARGRMMAADLTLRLGTWPDGCYQLHLNGDRPLHLKVVKKSGRP